MESGCWVLLSLSHPFCGKRHTRHRLHCLDCLHSHPRPNNFLHTTRPKHSLLPTGSQQRRRDNDKRKSESSPRKQPRCEKPLLADLESKPLFSASLFSLPFPPPLSIPPTLSFCLKALIAAPRISIVTFRHFLLLSSKMPSPSPQPRRSGIADLWTPRGSSSTSSGSSSSAAFNPARSTRSYLARVPLLTRVVASLIVALYLLDWLPFWDLRAWGGLVPSTLSFATRTHRPLLFASLVRSCV